MKTKLILLLLLIPITSFSQVDKLHILDIDLPVFPPVKEITLFNADTLIISGPANRIDKIPTGTYTIRFLSLYNDIYDTTIVFSKKIRPSLNPIGYGNLYRSDSIGYNQPIVNLMSPGDTLRIIYSSHGCFHYFENQLQLVKLDKVNYFVILSTDEKIIREKLSLEEVKDFCAWEFRLKWNSNHNYVGCFSIERRFRFILNHIYYDYFDTTCDEYDFDYIIRKLFKTSYTM